MKAYKGYTASVRFENGDNLLHGTVDGIRDVIHFAGTSVDELQKAFHDSVDDYLEWCKDDGISPERPYSGKLAFRTTPEHHRLISEAASANARSINQWMDDALAAAAKATLESGSRKIKLG